jgi:hypothetical protein
VQRVRQRALRRRRRLRRRGDRIAFAVSAAAE